VQEEIEFPRKPTNVDYLKGKCARIVDEDNFCDEIVSCKNVRLSLCLFLFVVLLPVPLVEGFWRRAHEWGSPSFSMPHALSLTIPAQSVKYTHWEVCTEDLDKRHFDEHGRDCGEWKKEFTRKICNDLCRYAFRSKYRYRYNSCSAGIQLQVHAATGTAVARS
jgi:hypothetical protein